MIHHTVIGFCQWDLPALIILLIVAAILLWRNHKLKKREEELQDQIDEYARNSDLANESAANAVPIASGMTEGRVKVSDNNEN